MFDALSFAELDGQHVELLPARSLMQTADIISTLTELVNNLGGGLGGLGGGGLGGGGLGGGGGGGGN